MPSVWIETCRSRGTRVYLVRWETVNHGIRHRGSKIAGPHKEQAEEFRSKKIKELYAGQLGIEAPSAFTPWASFAEAYLQHCQRHKSPNTYRGFDLPAMQSASNQFGLKTVQSISAADIARWEGKLSESFAPATVSMHLRALRTALNWGRRQGIVTMVPPIHLPKVAPVGRVLTDNEIKPLFEQLAPGLQGAFTVLLYTGMRAGELLALDWKAVRTSQDGRWEVEVGGIGGRQTKTRQARVVPLHEAAVRALGTPKASGKVFEFGQSWLNHGLTKAAARAGLGRVRAHDFRHTFATRFMAATGDLFALKAIGGWQSIESMRVYQHLTKGRTDGVFSLNYPQISPVGGGPAVDIVDGK